MTPKDLRSAHVHCTWASMQIVFGPKWTFCLGRALHLTHHKVVFFTANPDLPDLLMKEYFMH